MSEQSCACGGTDDAPSSTEPTDVDRWIDRSAPLESPLPRDVQTTMGRFFGTESIETLGEWVLAFRERTDGSAIDVDDLCHADQETKHWGVLDGETYHFQCFYDAVALAELADAPVEIRTESPDGTVVEARATGTNEVTVDPDGAVVSFGVSRSVEPPSDDGPTLQETYAAVCPYVKAFPDRESYEKWAESAPAATVGMPLADGTGVAASLVE